MPQLETATDAGQVKLLIAHRREECARPVVIGVSGYCGSGKSTLVRSIVDGGSLVRMRGDDFLDPTRSHRRSGDRDGVERGRLAEEVLFPFREERKSMFRRFDWTRRALGEPEPVPLADVLLVDLIGLFHPEALPALDLSIWVDVPLETAQARGMRRDEALGRDHTRLWRDVWIPNEIDFERNFSPRERSEVLYAP